MEWQQPNLRLGPPETRPHPLGPRGPRDLPVKCYGRDDGVGSEPPLRDVARSVLSVVAPARVPGAHRFAGRPPPEQRSAPPAISVGSAVDRREPRGRPDSDPYRGEGGLEPPHLGVRHDDRRFRHDSGSGWSFAAPEGWRGTSPLHRPAEVAARRSTQPAHYHPGVPRRSTPLPPSA